MPARTRAKQPEQPPATSRVRRRSFLEAAEVWNGYMDGAVRSGLRAAQEILTAQC